MTVSATTPPIPSSVAKAARIAVEHKSKLDRLGITPHLDSVRRANEKHRAAQLKSVNAGKLHATAPLVA